MNNTPWTDKEVTAAVRLCKASTSVEEALGKIRVELKRSTNPSNLREIFKRHGKPVPRDLVKRPAPSPLDLDAVSATMRQRATDRDVAELQRQLLQHQANEKLFRKLGKVPEIKVNRSRPKSGLRSATPISMASDWHIGESVSAEETLGKNTYDIAEARRRAANYWDNVLWLRKDAKRTQSCDDHVLNLNGDMISGAIHPELSETQCAQLADQVDECVAMIMPGIEALAADCRQLLVPCTHGNHGRITEKSRIKTGWSNSLETQLYRRLRDRAHDKGLDNVKFYIPRAENLQIDVMGYRLQFQHGTQFRSAGGIGGILVPLTKACTRMQASVFANYYFFGHFHTACMFEMVIVNGSLIGDSAYSRAHGMTYREPEQVNAVIDERRGLRRFDPVSVT